MPIEFYLPTSGKAVPSGPDWIHEVKYDGYRLRVERHDDRVKLTSRGGLDWTRRFPWIAETARKIRKTQFVIDGEAVVLGVDGISDFNALHSRRHDHEVQLYAALGNHRTMAGRRPVRCDAWRAISDPDRACSGARAGSRQECGRSGDATPLRSGRGGGTAA